MQIPISYSKSAYLSSKNNWAQDQQSSHFKYIYSIYLAAKYYLAFL